MPSALPETPATTDTKAAGRRRNRLARQRILRDWMFIAPQLTLFVLLTIVPFFVAIPILFTDMAQFNDPTVAPVGFRNFTALFTDKSVQADYIPALRRTLIFVALNYSTVYIFGLSLALLMYEVGFRQASSRSSTCP